jgi:hypothetical protein
MNSTLFTDAMALTPAGDGVYDGELKPPSLEPIGPGHPMEDIVHLAHGCDIRPSLTTFTPRTDGGPPVIEYWVRPKGVAPDVLFALSPSQAGGAPSAATSPRR